MPGALEGLRVIDFGQYIAGPLAAVMLSDQGADVIHVDPPGGPRWQHASDAFFQRGKRRISLDLKTPEDAATARRLIDGADVVIENFRPGVMDRLGLGAKAMTEANSRLIYCSMPGFAKDDPRADMQAWEGIVHTATENCIPRMGEEPPEWGWSRPFYSAVPLASNFAAFLGATGIVMALIARERTGLGQIVESPLFDAMFTLIGHSGAYVNSKGLHPPRPIHGRGAGSFRCKDGKSVQFDTSSARHLVWFAREAGLTETWDPDLLDIVKLRDESLNQRLHAKLRELFLMKTAAEWEEIGNRAGAAIGWCRTVNEWIDTDHAREIGAVVQLEDPELGPTWMAGLPAKLLSTPGGAQGPRRRPDADRAEILAEPPPNRLQASTNSEPDLKHPLQGMKVLDVCVALAGPTCGRLLLEFGAEVIKINAPKAGVGGYLNRGKRSLLLDLESFEAQEVYWKLVEQADVIVENFSPGTSDRLGIGYAEVRARKSDIIYTSGSCYGDGGPWLGRGWERQGQAVSGIMERASDPPSVLGPYNLVDIGTGTLATFGTALAIYHKLRTGQGQRVSASLCQTGTYHQTPFMLQYKGHVADEPRGYGVLGTSPFNRFYKARDRWFFLSIAGGANGAEASSLQRVEGLEALVLSAVTLEEVLEKKFATDTADTWVSRLRSAGISAQAHVTVAELMQDSYVQKRGLSVSQVVEGVGETTAPGVSVSLSRTPMRVGETPRRPGSDAPQILEEIGMADQLSRLEKAWVLQVNDLPPAWGGGG
jgi:crotonobetainyl-CoA:carnitine CoA-transferase CaiB-like acyl-CoA transferase